MKKVFKVLLLFLSLIILKKVSAATDLTFDDNTPILGIYESNYIDGDLGEINNYYIPSEKKIGFTILTSGKKVSWIKRGKETIIEDTKGEVIDINITSSNNISCVINNLREDIYSISGNTFTLLNQQAELNETKIGNIICTLPTTTSIIKLSTDTWLNIAVVSHNKNYVNNEIFDESITYRFNFGIINKEYLNSLNNSTELSSITIDGKSISSNKAVDIKTSNIKINRTKNSSKITLKLYDGNNNEKIVTELKDKEQSLNLQYGLNYLKVFETTEKSSVVSSLGNDYHLYGLSTDDFKYNNYEETYTINRLDTRSKVNTLKSLTISDTKLSFKPETTNYTLSVPYKVSSVKITSTLSDDKSTYLSNYGNRSVDLNEGDNNILIKVKAENGDIKTYTIKLTREKNNDASLKKLVINDKEIILKENLLSYSIIFDNEIKHANIIATATDSNAKVMISELKELNEGSNDVIITVTAANGDELKYNINIIRDKLISINSKLKNIIVKNHPINFNSDITTYNIKVANNEKKLDLIIEPVNDKATYKIIGNENIKNNSTITIEVTAADNKTKSIYTINILKDTKKVSSFLIIGIILILLIGIILIVKKKSK